MNKDARARDTEQSDREHIRSQQAIWELHKVKDVPTIIDETTTLYTVIHRNSVTETHKQYTGKRDLVRVDVMDSDNEPVISFQGTGDDVRRAVLQWWELEGHSITADHAGYIGYEIHRAMVDPDYVQA